MEASMDVVFVDSVSSIKETPSIALSLLKGELNRIGISSKVIYSNMVLEDTYISITGHAYTDYIRNYKFNFEKYFMPIAHDIKDLVATDLQLDEATVAFINNGQLIISRFLDNLVQEILAYKPKIVGLANMFFDNNYCLALARCLKKACPELIVIMGGANCTGSAAWAFVRDFDFIDAVFSGEADECIGELCTVLLKDGIQGQLPYGTVTRWSNFDEDTRYDAYPVRMTKKLDNMAYPDYSDYVEVFKKHGIDASELQLCFVEFSRGCWWHAIKPCTFCGLNGMVHGYRIKSTQRVLEELAYLHATYGFNIFKCTDNAISEVHIKQLLPQLIGKQYRFFAEVRTSLTFDQLRLFKQAGFEILQAGIENIQDDFLRLMNKGNRGIKHIEFLKHAAELNLFIAWNLLWAFPGDKLAYYEELNSLMPKLQHLQSPSGSMAVKFVKFSEYWLHPKAYQLNLQPEAKYQLEFAGKKDFVRDVALNYTNVTRPYTEMSMEEKKSYRLLQNEKKKMQNQLATWMKSFNSSNRAVLEYADNGECLTITDTRSLAKLEQVQLYGAARLLCLKAKQVVAKQQLFAECSSEVGNLQLQAAYEQLLDAGYLLEIKDEVLFLGINTKNTVNMSKLEEYHVL